MAISSVDGLAKVGFETATRAWNMHTKRATSS